MSAPPAPAQTVQLTARASGFARRGRPWFYRDDLAGDGVAPARLVRCLDEHGRDLGLGFTASNKLALRRCGPWPGEGLPGREDFFRARLDAAIAARAERLGAEQGARIVHAVAHEPRGLAPRRHAEDLLLRRTDPVISRAVP